MQSEAAYKAGYSACADEALRRIGQLDNISLDTRQSLVHGLSVHLGRPATTANNDIITAEARRRLFEPTSTLDDERWSRPVNHVRRRPLADIQPTIARDPPPVCRATITVPFCDSDCGVPVQFQPHYSCHDVPLSSQCLSQSVTLTQTMTTTLQQELPSTTTHHVDNRCPSTDAMHEPMWRPW